MNGDANYTVNNLVADLVDTGTGTLVVNTADNTADNTIAITTGSGATTVNSDTAGASIDTITVTATALANNTALTLTGADNFVVNDLKGDLAAATLSGTLTVTTADNLVDDTITITTGSGATSITGTANPTPDTDPG